MEFLIRACVQTPQEGLNSPANLRFLCGLAMPVNLAAMIFFRLSSNGRRSGQLKFHSPHALPLPHCIFFRTIIQDAARSANGVSDDANDVVNVGHMMAIEPLIYALSHLDGDGGVDEIGCADFNCGGPGHDEFNGIGGIHNTA